MLGGFFLFCCVVFFFFFFLACFCCSRLRADFAEVIGLTKISIRNIHGWHRAFGLEEHAIMHSSDNQPVF